MKSHSSHSKVAPASFFCEDCLTADPDILQDRLTIDFSEAKEEETDCHFCNTRSMNRQAEVLYNGYPSCRECRKRKSVMNFVAQTQDTNQKFIVTQVSNKDPTQSPTRISHRQNSQDFFANQPIPFNRSHNPHQSMALPSGQGLFGRTRHPTHLDIGKFSTVSARLIWSK